VTVIVPLEVASTTRGALPPHSIARSLPSTRRIRSPGSINGFQFCALYGTRGGYPLDRAEVPDRSLVLAGIALHQRQLVVRVVEARLDVYRALQRRARIRRRQSGGVGKHGLRVARRRVVNPVLQSALPILLRTLPFMLLKSQDSQRRLEIRAVRSLARQFLISGLRLFESAQRQQ
jgi:hypothetical protein